MSKLGQMESLLLLLDGKDVFIRMANIIHAESFFPVRGASSSDTGRTDSIFTIYLFASARVRK